MQNANRDGRTKRFACCGAILGCLIWLLAAVAAGQELIWQATLVEGTVQITENKLPSTIGTDAEIPEIPISIAEWRSGYWMQYYILDHQGALHGCSIADGDYPVEIPSAAAGKWFMASAETTQVMDGPHVTWLPSVPGFAGYWQIAPDLYVLNAWPTAAYLFSAVSGEMALLSSTTILHLPSVASNGVIAGVGRDREGRDAVQVFGPDRKLVFEEGAASRLVSYRDLVLAGDGEFLEYTTESRLLQEGPVRMRMRARLDTGLTYEVKEILPGGRLSASGHDLAVWSKGPRSLVVRLDEHDEWRVIDEIDESTYSAAVLAGGDYLHAVQVENGFVDLTFYDQTGMPRSGEFRMKYPFDVTQLPDGLLIVHSLGQTSLFRVAE